MRRRQDGQSIIEFALAVPVLAVLLFSTYSVGVLASDKVAANNAVRAGARLASELGGAPVDTNHDAYDRQIVSQVVAVSQAMSYETLQEIDIYRACAPVPCATPDPIYPGKSSLDPDLDRRLPNGNIILSQDSFVLSDRNQVPPGETPIVVLLRWTYTPPVSVGYFTLTLNDYAVMRAAPVFG